MVIANMQVFVFIITIILGAALEKDLAVAGKLHLTGNLLVKISDNGTVQLVLKTNGSNSTITSANLLPIARHDEETEWFAQPPPRMMDEDFYYKNKIRKVEGFLLFDMGLLSVGIIFFAVALYQINLVYELFHRRSGARSLCRRAQSHPASKLTEGTLPKPRAVQRGGPPVQAKTESSKVETV